MFANIVPLAFLLLLGSTEAGPDAASATVHRLQHAARASEAAQVLVRREVSANDLPAKDDGTAIVVSASGTTYQSRKWKPQRHGGHLGPSVLENQSQSDHPVLSKAAEHALEPGSSNKTATTQNQSTSKSVGESLNHTATSAKDAAKLQKNGQAWLSLETLVHMLLFLVVCEGAAAVLFEMYHRQYVNVDPDAPLPAMQWHEPRRAPMRGMFSGFYGLAKPYFNSPEGRKGRICAFIIVFMGLLGLFISYVHNQWQKAWWDIFSNRKKAHFVHLIAVYIVLALAGMLVSVYKDYIRSWLYIDWREYMTTRLMKRWLSCHTHFLLQLEASADRNQTNGTGDANGTPPATDEDHGAAAMPARGGGESRVDNPEQRIQEDIHLFTDSALDICPDFLSSLGTLLVFTPIVLEMEPKKAFGVFECRGWLLYAAVLYSLSGALATHLIGWPLSRFSFARQRYEADFRQQGLHVREHGESVALYGSEASEEAHLRERFERIKLVTWQQMILNKQLQFFTSIYGFVQFLVPFFILAPNYFNKEISLGDLFQLTGAIGNMAGALDWFIRIYEPLARWRATADRLRLFEAAIDEIQEQAKHAASGVKFNGPPPDDGSGGPGGGPSSKLRQRDGHLHGPSRSASSSEPGPPPPEENEDNSNSEQEKDDPADAINGLKANIAMVRLPGGEPIWQEVSVEVARGSRVLISGPDGVGKSLLFKALAGLWPYVESPDIRLPAKDTTQVLFVPQRPALPQCCSLAEVLSYPETREDYGDNELLAALRDVRLEELLAPPAGDGPVPGVGPATAAAGLDYVDTWTTRLSPGQQQRLALAHVLLRRPQVLFLDEATSGCSSQSATELYQVVLERLPQGSTVISISHDEATLAPLHDVHIAVTVDEDNASGPSRKELRILKGDGLASASAHGLKG